MNRSSPLVKVARLLQHSSPLVTPFEWIVEQPARLFHRVRKTNNTLVPFLCVLAPPRSGSTLTYQVLVQGAQGSYLTNISNILYTAPTLGFYVSHVLRRTRDSSNFQSQKGLVPGLIGEAEGLKFWQHWTGITLDQETGNWKSERAEVLSRKIDLFPRKPLISKYLGHIFCIEDLRRLFPQITFIHVVRNLDSNALSLYKMSSDKWASTKPSRCKLNGTRITQIADQIVTIHEMILNSSEPDDTYRIKYESLCTSPHKFLNDVVHFAKYRDHDLNIHFDKVPSQFEVPVLSDEDLELRESLTNALSERISRCSKPVEKILLSHLHA